jgi:hypothetical protein
MEKSSLWGWEFLLLFAKERNMQLAHAHNLSLPEAIFALAIKIIRNWAHNTPQTQSHSSQQIYRAVDSIRSNPCPLIRTPCPF